MEFVTELKKIGLSDKEAMVYLACVELGAATVQTIARKAKVVRATTYVILGALAKMGLVTEFKEGKKTLFAAEPPRQLLRVLDRQREAVEEREELLKRMLPELQALLKSTGERPSVRYFSGKEGLRAIRQEIVIYTKPGSEIVSLTPADYLDGAFPEDDHMYYRQRVAKGICSKTIFTTTSEEFKRRLLSPEFAELSERMYIAPKYFPSHSGLTVYEDRIAMSTYSGVVGGVVIDNRSMADMMRAFFYFAWYAAQQVGEKQTLSRQKQLRVRA